MAVEKVQQRLNPIDFDQMHSEIDPVGIAKREISTNDSKLKKIARHLNIIIAYLQDKVVGKKLRDQNIKKLTSEMHQLNQDMKVLKTVRPKSILEADYHHQFLENVSMNLTRVHSLFEELKARAKRDGASSEMMEKLIRECSDVERRTFEALREDEVYLKEHWEDLIEDNNQYFQIKDDIKIYEQVEKLQGEKTDLIVARSLLIQDVQDEMIMIEQNQNTVNKLFRLMEKLTERNANPSEIKRLSDEAVALSSQSEKIIVIIKKNRDRIRKVQEKIDDLDRKIEDLESGYKQFGIHFNNFAEMQLKALYLREELQATAIQFLRQGKTYKKTEI